MPPIPHVLTILKEACLRLGFSWRLADTYSNNLVEVSNGQKSFFSSNSSVGMYPLNSRFATQLVKDKAWGYKILEQKGYKIPKGQYFFLKDEYRELRGEGQELTDALEYARDKYPVFVKPNDSSLGILAEIIYNEAELKAHLEKIAEGSWIAIIQEVISQNEYRIFVVDGKIQFTYQRSPLCLTGDGAISIKDHILKINQNIKRPKNHIQLDNPFLKLQLKNSNLILDSVLKKNQRLIISPKSNLSAGGNLQNYSTQFSKATQEWVKKLSQDLSLRVCGIDVFTSSNLDNPEDFTIIEVNANPSLSGIYEHGETETALKIWEKILNKYFQG